MSFQIRYVSKSAVRASIHTTMSRGDCQSTPALTTVQPSISLEDSIPISTPPDVAGLPTEERPVQREGRS